MLLMQNSVSVGAAAQAAAGGAWDYTTLGWNLVNLGVFALVGIFMFLVAFWLISKLTPFSVQKEIEEDQNVALAVVMGSIVIGLAIILAAAIAG